MNSNLSRIGSQQGFSASNKWLVRLVTLTIWMLALLCVVYWGVKFTKFKSVSATPASIVPAKVVETQAVAQLLGSRGAIESKTITAAADTNFVLLGIANTKSGGGVALIAVDGKPAKPHRVGSQVTESWNLKSLSRTEVLLVSSSSSEDEMPLTLQPRQPRAGVMGSKNSGLAGTGAPRIPLPQRGNAVLPDNVNPRTNPAAINYGSVGGAAGLISNQSARTIRTPPMQNPNRMLGESVDVEEE